MKNNTINILHANLSFINYINNTIDMYKLLENNYIEICNDYENADRCYQYRIALSIVSDEFDRYCLPYENVSVWDYLNSNCVIWHMQSFIGKRIDQIMSWGYHYIMHDSTKLKNQLDMYEHIYDEIKRICNVFDVCC